MYIDYLLNVFKFKTDLNKYMTFHLGCFNVRFFNMALNIQLL